MAKNREQRPGLLARWYRRLRWLRRLAVIAGVAGGVAKLLRGRSDGGSGEARGGPGGSGRPAPIGGPSAPLQSASVLPEPAEDHGLTVSAARTLVAVPPLTEGEPDDDDAATSAPLLSVVSDDAESDVDVDAARTWVDPLEGGACPPGYPIKANDKSRIYHVPEGRSYNRTAANRCYPSAEAAEADGYRAAKA